MCEVGGGGYSDIFIHMKARVMFWGQKLEFQHFFFFGGGGGGFRLDMKILWIFLVVIIKLDYI